MNIIKGKHALEEALKADIKIERILVDFNLQNRPDIKYLLIMARQHGIKVQALSNSDFNRNTEAQNSQGLLAYVQMKKELDLAYLKAHKENYPFMVAVDHIQDPYNFGAILRTCESFGIKAVIYPKDRNVQITPGVIKASSGAIHYLDLIKVTNLAQALQELQKEDFWLYSADANEGQNLEEVVINTPLVLIVGNEQKGISRRISEMIDGKVKIATCGQTSSLNVSVATGILVYNFIRSINNQQLKNLKNGKK